MDIDSYNECIIPLEKFTYPLFPLSEPPPKNVTVICAPYINVEETQKLNQQVTVTYVGSGLPSTRPGPPFLYLPCKGHDIVRTILHPKHPAQSCPNIQNISLAILQLYGV